MGNPTKESKRLRSSYASAIISIALVLFMLGLLGLLVLDAKKISDYVKEHVQLTIYLRDEVKDSEVSGLTDLLNRSVYVRTVNYTSKEQALDSLKKELGESALSMIESNPLPATIDLNLRAEYAHPDSLSKIKTLLSTNPLIREVVYQQTEVDKMNKNFRTVAMIILVFCSLLLFVAVVLINNTIRLALYSKRFLIKSMQLVGATKGFIRKPFIGKSLVHGFYAAVISILLLTAIISLIQNRFPEFNQLADLHMLGLLYGSIIVFGLVLSGVSTFFAVNKYLRLHIDELY